MHAGGVHQDSADIGLAVVTVNHEDFGIAAVVGQNRRLDEVTSLGNAFELEIPAVGRGHAHDLGAVGGFDEHDIGKGNPFLGLGIDDSAPDVAGLGVNAA